MYNFCYSSIIVIIGFFGLLRNRKNLIFFLIYIEIIYNGLLLTLLLYGSHFWSFDSFVYFFISLAVIASEAVVGLVLVIVYQKTGANLDLENLALLNG